MPLGFMPGTMNESNHGSKKASRGPATARAGTIRNPGPRLRRCRRGRYASIDRLKPREALYIGGMGHKDKNFHKDMFIRAATRTKPIGSRNWPTAKRRYDHPGRVDRLRGLMGPPDRIKQRFKAWEDSGATSITVAPAQDAAVDLMAELARLNPPRD